MIFTITLSLFIPILMFLSGLLLRFAPPKGINNAFGYRTKRSMANQDAWDYAQVTSGKIYSIVGLFLIPISYYLATILNISSENTIIVIFALQFIFLFLPLTWVEYKLRKRFS